MKKFKTNKAIESFENDSLTKDQMYRLTGGKPVATGYTRSVCHIDGKDDGDGPIIIWGPIIIIKL